VKEIQAMRRGILSLLTLILLATGLLAPAAAFAGEQSQRAFPDVPPREESYNASARFRTFGRCLRTGMSVKASINDRHDVTDNNPTEPEVLLSFFMFKENLCTSTEFFAIEEHQYATGIQIGNGFNKASVKTTLQARDFIGDQELPVTIDLAWTGTGPLDVQKTVETHTLDSNGVPVVYEYRIRDFFRTASVTGTITVGNDVYRLSAADEDTVLFGFKVNTVQMR
jgi:hypothetical protein